MEALGERIRVYLCKKKKIYKAIDEQCINRFGGFGQAVKMHTKNIDCENEVTVYCESKLQNLVENKSKRKKINRKKKEHHNEL